MGSSSRPWAGFDYVHQGKAEKGLLRCFLAKGRRRKRYRDADIMTPYEKLKSLPEAAVYLTPGTTFQQLDAVAFALSDNDAARALHEARARLFRSIDPAA